jgi:hypothetical protein
MVHHAGKGRDSVWEYSEVLREIKDDVIGLRVMKYPTGQLRKCAYVFMSLEGVYKQTLAFSGDTLICCIHEVLANLVQRSTPMGNVEVQWRCAASSRSVPWNDGLGVR